MRPSDVKRLLHALLPLRRAVYLWGPPGVSKSQLVHQVAAEMEADILDWRALLRDPVDVRGCPSVEGRRTIWNVPAEFPSGGRGLFFLDEVAQAPPTMQQVCGQIALERRCGDYTLPEEWYVVAASNRPEDRAGTRSMPSNVLRRFTHIDVEVSNEDWQAWALAANVRPDVRSFLNFRPGLLFQFDPRSNPRSFPNPANWEAVSDLLEATPPDLLMPAVGGCVGEGPAAEFVAFRKIYQDLPDVDQVLASPMSSSVPRDPAVLYALSGALTEKVRGNGGVLASAVKYATRMPAEFSVLTMRDLAAVNQRVLSLPEAAAWLKTHRHLLLAGGK